MKARLALAGNSKAEIAQAVTSAFNNKELPLPEPGAMCYMMSKQQYLNDGARNWHPHLMWFVPGDSAKSWGAQLPGSPVIAANDPEERMTIMMVWVGHWSDGTPAPMQCWMGRLTLPDPHLAGRLTDVGLIDEYRFYVHPVVLGSGQPFFAGPRPRLPLVFSDRIGDAVIRLTYVPA